jgi:hypothetical protein
MKRLLILAVVVLAFAVAGAPVVADASHKGKPGHRKKSKPRMKGGIRLASQPFTDCVLVPGEPPPCALPPGVTWP